MSFVLKKEFMIFTLRNNPEVTLSKSTPVVMTLKYFWIENNILMYNNYCTTQPLMMMQNQNVLLNVGSSDWVRVIWTQTMN